MLPPAEPSRASPTCEPRGTSTSSDQGEHRGHQAQRPTVAAQTSLGLCAIARDAYDMWGADAQGVRIFDLRASEECALIGHAAMAIHALAAAGFTNLVNIPDGMECALVADPLQRLRRHADAQRLA